MNIEFLKRDYLKSVTQTDIIRMVFSFGVAVAWWIWDQDIWMKLMVIGMYEVILLRVLHFVHTQAWNNRLLVHNQAVLLQAILKSSNSDNLNELGKMELVDFSLIGSENDGRWYVHLLGISLKYVGSFFLCRLFLGSGFYDSVFSLLLGWWSLASNNIMATLMFAFSVLIFIFCWFSGLLKSPEKRV